jgi:hypothetical protein
MRPAAKKACQFAHHSLALAFPFLKSARHHVFTWCLALVLLFTKNWQALLALANFIL